MRKREDDDEPEDDANLFETIENVKYLKKISKRRKGLDLVEGKDNNQKKAAKGKSKNAEEGGMDEFAAEQQTNAFQQKLENEYVEKRFRQIVSKQGRILPEERKTRKQKEDDFMKELYSVPKEFQGKFTELPESEAGERWLSGMVEVELPVEYKLKNIEETEAAKAALLAPKKHAQTLLHIPSNYNQDFVRARQDDARKIELKRRMEMAFLEKSKRQKTS